MIYLLSGLLVIHGIICLLGAFFPFYPPVFLFYAFFPGHFAIRLIIVLLAGASQVVYGGYLLLKKRWHVRWYWLALTVVVFAGLLLIFPAFQGLFTPIPTATPEPPPYPSARPGPERPDDIVPTPGGPQYRANVHQEGVENPWPPIQTEEGVLADTVHVTYRANIETKVGEARNNIVYVRIPGKDIRSINLEAINTPAGIEVKRGIKWHDPRTIAQVLVIEISQDVEPGQYTFEIGVEIDAKDYGTIPCIIEVVKPDSFSNTPGVTGHEPAVKELSVERWETGDNWMYGPQAIRGDVMLGIVKQHIATYDLRSRETELVYELPPDRINQAPAIHGDNVVWASVNRDEAEQQRSLKRAPLPNWDVFLLDLKTGEVQQLTTEEHAQIYPRIYGDTVVWLDSRYEEEYHNPRRYDVYAYDLATGEEKRLTSATTADGMDLSIDGNLVVWADNRHADPEVKIHAQNQPDYNNEIYVYDLTTGQEKRLTSYPGNDHYPAISSSNIVWLRQEDYIRADVFVYNMQTGQESQVSKSNFADFQPSIHENRIAWVDARVSQGNTSGDTVINGRQGQTDIYLYDFRTQQEIKLTSTVPGQVLYNPVIYGDFVVYERIGMLSRIVYAAHLTFQ